MMYRVAKKPDSPMGIVLFLFLGRAGDGVLVGNDWFHFRRGRFVKDSRETLMRKPGYYIAPIREATAKDIERFECKVSKKWSVWNNCLTTVTARLMRNP